MYFSYSLTIPADTPLSAPEELDVRLCHGVITNVEVEFHPGCRGMVQAYVRHGLHQVWPTNPDGNLAADARAMAWNDYYELTSPPYVVTIGGCSPGASYDHEILFRFEVTPLEIAERNKMDDSWARRLSRVLGLSR